MAFLDYEFNELDTWEDIAKMYDTTVENIMTLNNIQMPCDKTPYELQESKDPKDRETTILVPEIFSGGETFENKEKRLFNVRYNYSGTLEQEEPYVPRNIVNLGSAVQGKCCLSVPGAGVAYFPCYPESYSDSHSANVGTQTPLGRSEPFQMYQSSGPRTVSVSFRMDREMARIEEIGQIVGITQAACYPTSQGTIIPRCTLVIGNNCSITGIIKSVTTNWSDTIIADMFMVCTLDFSIEECTGNPKTAGVVAGLWGR